MLYRRSNRSNVGDHSRRTYVNNPQADANNHLTAVPLLQDAGMQRETCVYRRSVPAFKTVCQFGQPWANAVGMTAPFDAQSRSFVLFEDIDVIFRDFKRKCNISRTTPRSTRWVQDEDTIVAQRTCMSSFHTQRVGRVTHPPTHGHTHHQALPRPPTKSYSSEPA